jgi:hypothetical protein
MAAAKFGVFLLSVGLLGCSLDSSEELRPQKQPDEVVTEPEPTSPPAGIVPFALAEKGIYEMDVDATHLYWVESGMFDDVSNIRRMPLDGGPIETLLTLPTRTYSIDVANGFVYAATASFGPDYGGQIYRVPVAGGEATILASGFNPTSVTADDCWVYYSEATSPGGRIMRVPTEGGKPQVVVDDVDNPWDLVVDDGVLFYSEMNRGRMMRLVPGHKPTVLASGWVGTVWMTVDSSAVYFSACQFGDCVSSDLMRVARDGGTAERLYADVGDESKLAVSGDKLVWGARVIPTTGGTVQPVPGDGYAIAVAASPTHAYYGDFYSGKIYRSPL